MARRPIPRPSLKITQPMRRIQPPPANAQPVVIPRPAPVQPAAPPPQAKSPAPRPAPHRPAPPQRRRSTPWWPLAILGGLAVFFASTCAALALGVAVIYGRGVLPNVYAAGVDLGGLSRAEAAAALDVRWSQITLRDGDRTWQFTPDALGLALDAETTARRAHDQGRSAGNAFRAILGRVEVEPAVTVDLQTYAVALANLAPLANLPPVDAGIAVVDGEVQATPPREGRLLDAEVAIAAMQADPAALLTGGIIDLPMRPVAPAVTDATPLLEVARALLASPLRLDAYDPITDTAVMWTVAPETWSRWLTAGPQGGLSLAAAPTRAYLAGRMTELGAPRRLDLDESAAALAAAIEAGGTSARARIYHADRQHTVAPGETLISIAWGYGVPYPWIQRANPGLGDTLRIGQTITIPSPDNFLEYPVVPGKRIVVSMSEQRTRVYEHGALKWDWAASTGIADSPTWPGVYQVLLHDPNAYAANWNLSMPWFVGVYRPVPGTAFTNGFHGFPTRGSSQLLWTSSLGRRVTYGCILLSSENARLLYDWAEVGVVVEIRP